MERITRGIMGALVATFAVWNTSPAPAQGLTPATDQSWPQSQPQHSPTPQARPYGPSAPGELPPGTVPAPATPAVPTAPEPGTPTSPFAPATPGAGDDAAGAFETASPAAGGVPGGAGGVTAGNFAMLGDQAPIFGRPIPPPRPNQPGQPRSATALLAQKGLTTVPWIRAFKIADNQSPVPQDRVYFNFNYYNNVNYAVNQRLRAPVAGIQIYRYLLGFEKTFLDGMASVGIRDSINTLSAVSPRPGLGGTSTAMGDLSVYAKMILYQEWEDSRGGSAFDGFGYPAQVGGRNGYLISAGLSVNLPTGPGSFAGSTFSKSFRNTALQPFAGYFYAKDNFYLQGFEAISVPTDPNDVTILYNDIGIGYYLYRNPSSSFITAFAPTFEVHVNVPLNHRDVFNVNDPVGTADVVDLTTGGNIQIGQRTVLLLGAVTPVTGPRPFSIEAVALLNFYFGGRRNPPAGGAFPLAGQ